MPRVEQYHTKLLDRSRAVVRPQVAGDVTRSTKLRAVIRCGQRPASELNGGHDSGGHRRTDAAHPPQLALERARQSLHTSREGQHAIRHIERALVLGSVTKDRGEQLVVPERRQPKTPELLAGPIVRRHKLHAAKPFKPPAA